jgi:hypothetical protein
VSFGGLPVPEDDCVVCKSCPPSRPLGASPSVERSRMSVNASPFERGPPGSHRVDHHADGLNDVGHVAGVYRSAKASIALRALFPLRLQRDLWRMPYEMAPASMSSGARMLRPMSVPLLRRAGWFARGGRL